MKNKESEHTERIGTDVPIITNGIGTRISALSKLVGGMARLAELSGLSQSQMRRIIAESSQAKIETIAAIARETGVSIVWLAFGEGEMRGKSAVESAATRDHSGDVADNKTADAHAEYRVRAVGQSVRESRLMLERVEWCTRFRPPKQWRELLKTLVFVHGLDESGVERIIDLLKQEAQHGD